MGAKVRPKRSSEMRKVGNGRVTSKLGYAIQSMDQPRQEVPVAEVWRTLPLVLIYVPITSAPTTCTPRYLVVAMVDGGLSRGSDIIDTSLWYQVLFVHCKVLVRCFVVFLDSVFKLDHRSVIGPPRLGMC